MRFRTLYLQTCAVLRVEYFYSFRVDDTITAFPHECLAGKGSEMGTADWIRGYAWVGLIWRLQEAHSPKPQGYIKSDAIMDFYYYIKSIDRILPHPSLIKKESRKDNKNKLKQELSTESRPMKKMSRIWVFCGQIDIRLSFKSIKYEQSFCLWHPGVTWKLYQIWGISFNLTQ